MNNREKAKEIAKEYRAMLAANTDFDVNDLDLAEEDATRITLEMAEWKDQQWEKKIREWLTFNTNWTSEFDEEGRNPDYGKIDEMFNDIKNGLI